MQFSPGPTTTEWPPMLRLVMLGSLPALALMALVIAKSIWTRLRPNNRRHRSARARKRRLYRRVDVMQLGVID